MSKLLSLTMGVMAAGLTGFVQAENISFSYSGSVNTIEVIDIASDVWSYPSQISLPTGSYALGDTINGALQIDTDHLPIDAGNFSGSMNFSIPGGDFVGGYTAVITRHGGGTALDFDFTLQSGAGATPFGYGGFWTTSTQWGTVSELFSGNAQWSNGSFRWTDLSNVSQYLILGGTLDHVSAVPEPMTGAMLAVGLGMIAVVGRRRTWRSGTARQY